MAIFEQLQKMGHEQVAFCHDPETGLKAIIAVHDTTLGPALGGCRMWDYQSEEEALVDVLRLSRGMTYKAAVTGLNLGGGKSVIIGNPNKLKSEAFFRTFGRFVHSLNGRYITAEDVNIRVEDIEHVAAETPYVTGVNSAGGSGDPSPVTAWGVYHGIRAAVSHKLGRDSLKGVRVAVQGCGAVGYNLIRYLSKDGAKVFASDIDDKKVERAVAELGAEAISNDGAHKIDADVYAPCALGGILNERTIPELKSAIVAGAANNQLLDETDHSAMLKERDILYAPDYVINAGGLINVYQELRGYNKDEALKKASGIYHTLINVFEVADQEGITSILASNRIAEKRLDEVRRTRSLSNTYNNQRWIAR